MGFFWMYGNRLRLDGEGIGRFCVRLAAGLLCVEGVAGVTVVTNPGNYADVAGVFAAAAAGCGDRLRVVAAESPAWANENAAVDVWIVPYVGLAGGQFLTRPYVVCIHDLFYTHFPAGRQSRQTTVLDMSARQLAARAALAVFNSDSVRVSDGVGYLGLPPARTRTVPLAAPAEEYAAFGVRDEGGFRGEYGLQEEYIVFPSALRFYKNHRRLIAAFIAFLRSEEGRGSGVRLVLTDFPQNFERQEELRALAAGCDAGLRRRVYFIGRIPAGDVPALYRYSRGVIVPTLFEGSCPFPILEALLMERPVAFGRLAVVREVIADWREFFTFDPYCETDMAQAIACLCRAGPEAAVRQRAAAGTALRRTWRDVAGDYYALLTRLA